MMCIVKVKKMFISFVLLACNPACCRPQKIVRQASNLKTLGPAFYFLQDGTGPTMPAFDYTENLEGLLKKETFTSLWDRLLMFNVSFVTHARVYKYLK